ncbi:MAG: TlpA disulfide reductase family protein [Cytophagales bacterium]
MRLNYLLIGLFSILIACQSEMSKKDNEFIIEGKVNYLRDGYVKVIIRKGEGLVTLDSVKVNDDSTFVLKGIIEDPQYAQLNFFDKQIGIFPLTPDKFTALADGNQSGGKFEVQGTEEAALHKKLTSTIADYQLELMELKQKLTYAMGANEESKSEDIRNELIGKLDSQNEWVKSFVDSLGTGNIVAGYALVNYLNPVEQFDFFDQKVKEIEAKEELNEFEIRFISQFNNKRAEIEQAVAEQKIKREMEQKLAIGKQMPDIALPNPNGKTLNLSDYRGKVVLVDFWAGWCRPCRQENPNLVAAYKKYNKKGFEIFGVSLDKNREQWLNAIEQDNMTWPQVSDLQYWQSGVVKDFNITGIPANFLLDEKGIIIARNLRGPALHSKLEQVL